jgi:MFS family permease
MTEATTTIAADRLPHEAVEAGEARPGAWFTLWAMLAITMFAFVDRQVITLLAAPMSQTLHLTDAQLGAVQGLAFAIFGLAAVYPIAWLADRLDRRIVMGACILVWSAGTIACGLAQSYEQLFIAAIAIAAGEAGLAPIAMSIVPDLFTGQKRITANSVSYLASYAGISAALVLTGAAIATLAASHDALPPVLRGLEPWRVAFLAVASPVPIFLVLCAFMRLRRPERVATTAISDDRLMPYLRAHGGTVLRVCLAFGLTCFAYGGYLVWLPVATARLFGVSPAENGLWMGVATAGGTVIGVACATWLMARYRPIYGHITPFRLAWVVLLAATPLVLGFAFVQTAWQAFVMMGLMMLVGTFFGCLTPNVLQDLAPSRLRARVMALYGMGSTLLVGFAPALVGKVSDMIGGPRSILIALSVVALPTWLVGIAIMRSCERPFERTASENAKLG